MDLLYNKERDLSPVIEEPVLSISHVLETGIVPSGGVDDDTFDYSSDVVDTSHVIGRVVDPFDAIEVNKMVESYTSGLRKRYNKSQSDAAFRKAVAEAVTASNQPASQGGNE